MKDLIIIGSGGHARSVIDSVILKNQLRISGVIDIHNEENTKEKILGFPILGGMKCLEKINPEKTAIFLAIGDNKIRKKISIIVENHGFDSVNVLHPQAYVSQKASLGKGNFVGAFTNIGPGAEIGNYCLVNTSANLEHEVSVGDFCQFGPGAIVCGRSNISDDVFVGASAVVKDKISIPTGVVIGAGAVVTKKITEKNSIFIGVPARKV